MKKTAKATKKPPATRTKKAASSGAITGMLPLDQVLGRSIFYANIQATGGGPFTSAELPITPPDGFPLWLTVASITGVGYAHVPELGVLTVFHANAEVTQAQDGSPVLMISGNMQFDRQAPNDSAVAQIDVSGHLIFYSVPASAKAALKRSNAARIKILPSRPRR